MIILRRRARFMDAVRPDGEESSEIEGNEWNVKTGAWDLQGS